MIVTAYGMPWHGIHATFENVQRIRDAAPNTHLMGAAPEGSFVNSAEATRKAFLVASAEFTNEPSGAAPIK